MWPQMNSNRLTGLKNHYPSSIISDREDPLIWFHTFFLDVILKTISHFLRDKYYFRFLTAFRFAYLLFAQWGRFKEAAFGN